MNKPPPKQRRRDTDEPIWLYGRHAVLAALSNKARHQHKLLATKNALDWLAENGKPIPVEPVKPDAIDKALPPGAVHQGLAVKVNPLPDVSLEEMMGNDRTGPVIVLDQVTDPQNIGAVFRLGAAFSAKGIVAQDRRTPPLSGALAKAAVGAVETVPFVSVVNIARSLEALKSAGIRVAGLAGDDDALPLPQYAVRGPVALVLGAEGAGLRALVRETCDDLVRIPMSDEVESLNVATAAGIALYGLTRPSP